MCQEQQATKIMRLPWKIANATLVVIGAQLATLRGMLPRCHTDFAACRREGGRKSQGAMESPCPSGDIILVAE